MRAILISLIMALMFCAPVFAGQGQNVEQPGSKQCEKVENAVKGSDQVAQSGCCSWHGGVCGCSNGRVVCCDGTLSPTCTCP
jgi:hypothetical protein